MLSRPFRTSSPPLGEKGVGGAPPLELGHGEGGGAGPYRSAGCRTPPRPLRGRSRALPRGSWGTAPPTARCPCSAPRPAAPGRRPPRSGPASRLWPRRWTGETRVLGQTARAAAGLPSLPASAGGQRPPLPRASPPRRSRGTSRTLCVCRSYVLGRDAGLVDSWASPDTPSPAVTGDGTSDVSAGHALRKESRSPSLPSSPPPRGACVRTRVL